MPDPTDPTDQDHAQPNPARRLRAVALWAAYAAVLSAVVFLGLEGLIRAYPAAMPFSAKWTYARHYEDISRIFRGVRPYGERRPEVIAIGDSFTRGAEVAPGRAWPAVLTDDFGIDVFNWGIGGSSTVEQMVLLEGMDFQNSVERVVLAVFRNDPEANVADVQRYDAEGPAPFVQRAQVASHIGVFDRCRDDSWYLGYDCWYYRSYAVASFANLYYRFQEGEQFQKTIPRENWGVFDTASQTYVPPEFDLSGLTDPAAFRAAFDEPVRVTAALIARIDAYLAERGVRLLVAYLPSKTETYLADWAPGWNPADAGGAASSGSIGGLLGAALAPTGIPFRDLTPAFRAARHARAPLYLAHDPHPNDAGHRLIAERIAEFLHENPPR